MTRQTKQKEKIRKNDYLQQTENKTQRLFKNSMAGETTKESSRRREGQAHRRTKRGLRVKEQRGLKTKKKTWTLRELIGGTNSRWEIEKGRHWGEGPKMEPCKFPHRG